MINLAVLHRSALLDMDQMDLPLFAPAQEMATRQFRPVAAPSRFRHTPMLDHHLKRKRYPTARQTYVYFYG
jgi:hypothetical protein